MKSRLHSSFVVIYGCLAGIAAGFSPSVSVVERQRASSTSNRRWSHHPFDPCAQAELSFGPRHPSLLYASKRTVNSWDASLTSRRKWMSTTWTTAASSLLALTSIPTPAHAKKGEGVVGDPFDAIRYEVSDPQGGVAYLRSRISDRDFVSVLDFTKEYDLVLRKIAMGTAKKRLPKGPIQDKGTEICNAVTFDLIGINRNSRKGQENPDEAMRYLDELVTDAKRMIELEPYAEAPPPSS